MRNRGRKIPLWMQKFIVGLSFCQMKIENNCQNWCITFFSVKKIGPHISYGLCVDFQSLWILKYSELNYFVLGDDVPWSELPYIWFWAKSEDMNFSRMSYWMTTVYSINVSCCNRQKCCLTKHSSCELRRRCTQVETWCRSSSYMVDDARNASVPSWPHVWKTAKMCYTVYHMWHCGIYHNHRVRSPLAQHQPP